jgi:nicotinamidase-related amidase
MKSNTALLVMDMQMGILGRLPQQGAEIIKKTADAIKTAKENGIPVIFVRVGFQKGLPEISRANKSFYTLKDHLTGPNLDAFMQISPALGTTNSDIIVNKKRVSAFAGSDLEMILRAQNISHLVLSGIATSGVVLSTLREAFDKDYQLTILSDACADSDEEIHQFLIQKLFPKQGEVMTIDEWKTKGLSEG